MATLSQLVQGMNIGSATPQAWVDVPWNNIDDPFLSKQYPGLILFAGASGGTTFELMERFSNGNVLMRGNPAVINCIKYIHNGYWLNKKASDTIPANNVEPCIDVILLEGGLPLKIVQVLNDIDIIVSDPNSITDPVGSLKVSIFTKIGLCPNKSIELSDPNIVSIHGLGGEDIKSVINPVFTEASYKIEQILDAYVGIIGLSSTPANVFVTK